jgi:hypothetical protein
VPGDYDGDGKSDLAAYKDGYWTVYSLANTLTQNLTEIKRVRFQVGGKDVTTIKGHVDLREPISPNKDLVKQTAAGG